MIMEVLVLIGVCLIAINITGVVIALLVNDLSEFPAGAIVFGVPLAVIIFAVGLIAIGFGWFRIGG